MISRRMRVECRKLVNHTYVGTKILPLVGDFASQARRLIRNLSIEKVLTEEQSLETNRLIDSIEKGGDDAALKTLVAIVKRAGGLS